MVEASHMTDSGLKTDAGEPSFTRTTARHSPQLDRENPREADAPYGSGADKEWTAKR
jgi:hypothetical protein